MKQIERVLREAEVMLELVYGSSRGINANRNTLRMVYDYYIMLRDAFQFHNDDEKERHFEDILRQTVDYYRERYEESGITSASDTIIMLQDNLWHDMNKPATYIKPSDTEALISEVEKICRVIDMLDEKHMDAECEHIVNTYEKYVAVLNNKPGSHELGHISTIEFTLETFLRDYREKHGYGADNTLDAIDTIKDKVRIYN